MQLPKAQNYEYIGINQASRLFRGGNVINLETITDARIEKMIAEDPYWANQFKKKTVKAVASSKPAAPTQKEEEGDNSTKKKVKVKKGE